ncbi:MAG: ABC transporter permease [Candidatus Aenigmarchaeota archaeon]|nr:ABC transporter permease [Candidatus Aenigmarchaeota archaeon]
MKHGKTVLLGPGLALLAWYLIAELRLVDAFFLPGPIATISELLELAVGGGIITDALLTLERVFLAFVIAVLVGIPVGLFLGTSRRVYESLEMVIDFFRSIPATAIFPLFVVVFGIEDSSKIAVASFASALIILFHTAHGVMHAKKSRTLAARLMGATKLQVFRFVSFWECLPQIFVGLRTAVSLSLVIVVVTEMFIGTYAGLGRRLIDFQYVYNIEGMYAIILLTGIIGYLINAVFILLERRVVHWSGK